MGKMHLHFSQIILVSLGVFVQSYPHFVPSLDFGRIQFQLPLTDSNATRSKRQLFREDIPHHRPLTGNGYASQHGFPHPGRWHDGTTNPYTPSGNLPPPHQHYIDMLDGARPIRYNNNDNNHNNHKGTYSGSVNSGGYNKGQQGQSFGNDGGFDNGFNFGDDFNSDFGPPYTHEDNNNFNGFGGSEHGNNENDGQHYGPPKYQEKEPAPNYGPQNNHNENHNHHQQQYNEEPKTIVHYHPVQFSQVVNIDIPERKPTPHNDHDHGHDHSYGPLPQAPSSGYGPPNHVSGPLIEVGQLQGGFIPSKGILPQVPNKPHQHQGHHQHQEAGPYRFDPFKILSHSPSHLETEGPVAIPILAQFHSKPVKVTKIKEPQLIYQHHNRHPPHHSSNGQGHGHGHGGHFKPQHQHQQQRHPGHRRPHYFSNFLRRPKLPPPPPRPPRPHHNNNNHDWYYSHF